MMTFLEQGMVLDELLTMLDLFVLLHEIPSKQNLELFGLEKLSTALTICLFGISYGFAEIQ